MLVPYPSCQTVVFDLLVVPANQASLCTISAISPFSSFSYGFHPKNFLALKTCKSRTYSSPLFQPISTGLPQLRVASYLYSQGSLVYTPLQQPNPQNSASSGRHSPRNNTPVIPGRNPLASCYFFHRRVDQSDIQPGQIIDMHVWPESLGTGGSMYKDPQPRSRVQRAIA
jgi:hypothetical protein